MSDHIREKVRPSPTGLIAGTLVILGILLWMFVSKALIIVAGLGAFGPGILRELGILKDHDEFQRQSAHRAGYYAYLVGGVVIVFILSALEWSGTSVESTIEWIRCALVVLWASWMFSALLAYWGARRTARVVLLTFGSFWALFIIASLFGESDPNASFWQNVLGIVFGTSLIAAFYIPAWTAYQWPRATGAFLLVVAALSLLMFARNGGLDWSTVVLTNILLAGPLLGSGIALLRERPERASSD